MRRDEKQRTTRRCGRNEKDKIFSIKKELKDVKYVKKQNWKLYYFGFYLSLFAIMDS
jgi:hypothetical protein